VRQQSPAVVAEPAAFNTHRWSCSTDRRFTAWRVPEEFMTSPEGAAAGDALCAAEGPSRERSPKTDEEEVWEEGEEGVEAWWGGGGGGGGGAATAEVGGGEHSYRRGGGAARGAALPGGRQAHLRHGHVRGLCSTGPCQRPRRTVLALAAARAILL
jgi:hypothetical protein